MGKSYDSGMTRRSFFRSMGAKLLPAVALSAAAMSLQGCETTGKSKGGTKKSSAAKTPCLPCIKTAPKKEETKK